MKSKAELVKELHERSGVGIAKCKEALDNSNFDIEKAVEYLRKTGLATAVKKESREAKEGIVISAETATVVAIMEVSAETDFVTKNARFREFANNVCQEAAKTSPKSVESFLEQPYSKEPGMTINEYRAGFVQSLGENIQIKRLNILPKHSNCSIGIYSHMDGKILSFVEIEGSTDVASLARDIAMHAAAEAPEYISIADVPNDIKAKEEEIARSQIKGKPEPVIAKILEGKMAAFYNRVCLDHQNYIKDDTITISELLKREEKRVGTHLHIKTYLRWKAGE